MVRKILGVLFIVVLVLVALPMMRQISKGGKQSLTPAEQQVWDRFLSQHLSAGSNPSEEDADAVAAMGDKIVPYIEDQFGAAARIPGAFGKGEYWLIIVLVRTGSPRAIDAIVTVLEHDFQGAVETNRETAAKALVWLGARDRAPALEAAIADHAQLVAKSKDPQRYCVAVDNLKQYLGLLKKGEGQRDKSKFPFGPSLIKEAIYIPVPRE
jgi:hypothetical protein